MLPNTLKIIVTVKQVPDTHNVTGEAMKADGTVNRNALPAIFNPEDLHALEEALKLKERINTHITAITMGPPKSIEILKECLYRGVDEVVLLSDPAFAGADTLATSYALKSAIEKLGGVDLIFCGRQAIDGDTAQVPPQIAEKLSFNQLTNVVEVLSIDRDKRITVKRETSFGYEILRSSLPLLITVNDHANIPRPPSAKLMMAYKNLSPSATVLKNWNLATIGADPKCCGLNGSPTKVKKIENVVLAKSQAKQFNNTEESIKELINELVCDHIIG
ncbi:MAG: electron transfer flavoprotein subunit beta/FixA family protein [Oligoflexia bacterium]|nr:electron transfer flavoprotein subunit beta/FixA family protein [Oligoflexia bacterium]